MKFAIIEKSTGNIVKKYEREDSLKHQAWGGNYGNKNYCDHVQIIDLDENYLLSPVPQDAEGDWALAEDVTLKTMGDKKVQIEIAYGLMFEDSIAHMESAFGTKVESSAVAYEKTWNLMVSDPAFFASEGLSARFDRGGLLTGEALDTDQKVLDYANDCLVKVKSYAIWRMKRIQSFRDEKATIESA